MYDHNFIEQVKAANDILDVARDYYDNIIQINNDLYKTHCKHGSDSEPSLTFRTDTQSFYCYGCGAGSKDTTGSSDVIGFVKWMENCSFSEAVEKLAKRKNIPLPAVYVSPITKLAQIKHQALYANKQIYRYCLMRGLTKDMMDRWLIGAEGDKLVIPIFDKTGNVVGFAYRMFNSEPKYINSSTSNTFQKGKLLYGYHLARQIAKSEGYCVLVEGYMDAIFLHSVGVPAVASMGTSCTEDQMNLLRELTDTVIICFDGDSAGRKAALKLAERLDACHIHAMLLWLDDGIDPDDLAKQYKDNTKDYIMRNAIKLSQYKLNKAIEVYNTNISKAVDKLLHTAKIILASLHDPTEQLSCAMQISNIIGKEYTSQLLEVIKNENKE